MSDAREIRDPAGWRCGFAPDTLVETDEGPMPLGWVGPGRSVQSLDAGMVEVRAVEAAPLAALSRSGAAIRIPADAIEDGAPGASVTVAPGHLLLIRHSAVSAQAGEAAVLVEAADLVGINGIAWERCREAEFLRPVLARPAMLLTARLASAAPGPGGALPGFPVLHSGEALALRRALGQEWRALRQSA